MIDVSAYPAVLNVRIKYQLHSQQDTDACKKQMVLKLAFYTELKMG